MIHYNVASGHAPGDVRAAFTEAVEDLGFNPSDAGLRALKVAAGRLWNCTDTLPAEFCTDLGIALGSSYAQAARHVIRRF